MSEELYLPCGEPVDRAFFTRETQSSSPSQHRQAHDPDLLAVRRQPLGQSYEVPAIGCVGNEFLEAILIVRTERFQTGKKVVDHLVRLGMRLRFDGWQKRLLLRQTDPECNRKTGRAGTER